MVLCSQCQALRIFEKFDDAYDELRIRIQHHRTEADLLTSGQHGCELCVFIYKVLAKAIQSYWVSGITMSRTGKLKDEIHIQVDTLKGICDVSLIVFRAQGEFDRSLRQILAKD